MIKLYHGSNVRVEKPDLKKSKPYKDFGQGFYLSDDFRNFRPPSKFGNRFLLPVSGICCFLFAEWSGKGGILLEMSNSLMVPVPKLLYYQYYFEKSLVYDFSISYCLLL